MIETSLLNYGILGLWTISLMIDRYRFQKDVTKAIRELTKAIREKF
jgi:hypothetical protein